MQKTFDEWNKRKKEVDNLIVRSLYHRREVWWCTLGTNIGFEQDGTGTGYQRPVLVIRGFSASVCLVVPLTTSLKDNKYHISAGVVDGKQAFVIISQIRLIDTKRLAEKIGYISIADFETIRKAVRDLI